MTGVQTCALPISAGLEVAWLTALIAALFPVAAAMRLVQRLAPISPVPRAEIVPVPRPLNRLLIAFHRWEAAVAQHVRLPCGLSLLAVARKPTR